MRNCRRTKEHECSTYTRAGLARLVLFGVSVVALGVLAQSAPVGREQAHAVATSFLASTAYSASVWPQSATGEKVPILLHPGTEQPLAYVYALLPTGYVILAADTRIQPIVAYSDTSAFSWQDVPQNVLLHLLRVDLSSRLAALSDGVVDPETVASNVQAWRVATEGLASPQAQTVWGPWIDFPTWNQTAPYWNDCPIDPLTELHCYTGCGPTALAQILNYWRYPLAVSFSADDNYTTETRGIVIEAAAASITAVDYADGLPTDETRAALSYAAGVSVEVDYTSDGSSSSAANIAAALGGDLPDWGWIVNERWAYATADFRTTDTTWQSWPPYYVTEAGLYALLRADMQDGHPAILSIKSDSSGHLIVADGYKSTGEYHLNFGWGGTADGWYFLPDGMPHGYNVVERGVFGISPPLPSPTTAVFRVDADGNALADGALYAHTLASGSADVAEWTRVAEAVEAGDVLELAPNVANTYRLSQTAFSQLVGGVVSTEPGVLLGTAGGGSRQALIALAGIVPTKVTNEGGPIRPGDLLVTSSTPGHAMRWAGDGPCLCALVGKALEPMTDYVGVILVLLTAH